MSDVERDPLVRRAIDELRDAPGPDRHVVARVVAAAAAARVTPADDEPMTYSVSTRRRWSLGRVGGAAALAGFALSSMNSARRHSATPVATQAAAAAPVANAPTLEMQSVGSNSADALPVPRQFVFHS